MDGAGHGFDRKVVVPAIDAASSVACMRSLGPRGIETIAISEQDRPPGFESKYADETVSVADPAVDLPAYEDAVLDLARRQDVTTIIPVREADVYVLARNLETLAEHVATAWPSLPTLRRVQDRKRLFEAADAADVSFPRTRPLDEWTDWDADVVVKPRYTVHAPEYWNGFDERRPNHLSTRYVADDSAADREGLVAEMDHVPLVQEYVPDTDEYAFFALYDRGEAVATFQHRQRRGWKYAGGPSAYRESVDIPALDAAGRELLDHLEWHGLAMVEFLRDPVDGEFLLMEVNPRFWTSLPFTIQAGVDFPYLYWKQATGQSIPSEPTYEVGIGGHLLRGELLHVHSILAEEYPVVDRPPLPKTLLEIGASLLSEPRFDYATLDDPGPFLRDSHNTAIQLFSGQDPPARQEERRAHDRRAESAPRITSIGDAIRSTIKRL